MKKFTKIIRNKIISKKIETMKGNLKWISIEKI